MPPYFDPTRNVLRSPMGVFSCFLQQTFGRSHMDQRYTNCYNLDVKTYQEINIDCACAHSFVLSPRYQDIRFKQDGQNKITKQPNV